MKGAPIENIKKAMVASLSKLNQDDFFNIIAFNGEIYVFSSSMELATPEALRQAGEWMTLKFIPEGDTNILLPLNQVLVQYSYSWLLKAPYLLNFSLCFELRGPQY